jgi:hypothetical protein
MKESRRLAGDVRFRDHGPDDHDGEDSLDRDEDSREHGPEELHRGSYAGGAEDSVTLAVWWLPDESTQLTSTLSFG